MNYLNFIKILMKVSEKKINEEYLVNLNNYN